LRFGLSGLILFLSTRLADAVHEVDERQEHGDDDAADDDGQETIMIGSSNEVMAATALSTSSS
jgi:hypothetical protein